MARKIIPNPNICAITHIVNILGNKWKPVILYVLSASSLRFGGFNEFLPTISKKVLTEQLKELQDDGLIVRQSFPEIPPRVEYSLSEKAQGLLPILREMNDWVVNNYSEIEFKKCLLPPNQKRKSENVT